MNYKLTPVYAPRYPYTFLLYTPSPKPQNLASYVSLCISVVNSNKGRPGLEIARGTRVAPFKPGEVQNAWASSWVLSFGFSVKGGRLYMNP